MVVGQVLLVFSVTLYTVVLWPKTHQSTISIFIQGKVSLKKKKSRVFLQMVECEFFHLLVTSAMYFLNTYCSKILRIWPNRTIKVIEVNSLSLRWSFCYFYKCYISLPRNNVLAEIEQRSNQGLVDHEEQLRSYWIYRHRWILIYLKGSLAYRVVERTFLLAVSSIKLGTIRGK